MDARDKEMESLKKQVKELQDSAGIRTKKSIPRRELEAELTHLKESTKRSVTTTQAHRMKELEKVLGVNDAPAEKNQKEEAPKK